MGIKEGEIAIIIYCLILYSINPAFSTICYWKVTIYVSFSSTQTTLNDFWLYGKTETSSMKTLIFFFFFSV